MVGDLVAGLPEDRQHLLVGGQHVRAEAAHAVLAGRGREVLQQHGADPPALVRVGDVERDLGVGTVQPAVTGAVEALVATDADDLVPDRDHEPDPVDVVDGDEALHVGSADLRHGGEEPEVDALGALGGVEPGDAGCVVETDRAHVGDAAVAQHDVGLPVVRVGPSCAGRTRPAIRGHDQTLPARPAPCVVTGCGSGTMPG